jgi:hypothetical protein
MMFARLAMILKQQLGGMANKHTNLQAVDSQGQHVSLNHTSTDSPLLPVANLQQLQAIDPKLVTG